MIHYVLLKKIRIKGNTKAWFDSEVISIINKRDDYYKKLKSSGLETDKDLLKAAKISLKNMIQKKKRTFFQDKLKENSNKSNELWKTLKSLGMNSKNMKKSKICLKENGVTQFEPKKNENIFKTFYSELAGNLVKKLPKPPLKFNTDKTMIFCKKLKPNLEKFELVCITEETIKKLSCCLDVSKVLGMDEIFPRFLKDGTEVLAKPICDIINLSIKLSTFPDKYKIANLTPLFKKGSKTDPRNYRPISLLPLISKLIEKAIHIQTQEYLDKNGLIYKFQSGFRKNCSTDSCLAQLTDYIIKGMNKEQHIGTILIDLLKAFDTLDHDALLKKNGMCRF